MLAFVLAACSGDSDSSSKPESSTTEPSTTEGSTSDAQPASVPSDGPEAAIASYLDGQGIDYVGDCATAQQPRDNGKWCSTLVSGGGEAATATYELGPVGQQPEKTITLTRKGEARLTPGYQVGVVDGTVGTPSELTRDQLQSDAFITGNLQLDQAAGIGGGLADLPAGVATPPAAPGGAPDAGGGTGGGTPPIVVDPGGPSPQYPPNGDIVVPDPVVDLGGEVAFNGGGCAPDEPLTVLFDGQPIGTITADPSGRFAGSISIPRGTAPGVHTLTVRGSACVLNASITVLGNNLAFTGSSSHTSTYVLAGVAAVVVGSVLVVGTRRRRYGVQGRRRPPSGAA